MWKFYRLFLIFLTVTFLQVYGLKSIAQQTIVSLPNSEVLPPGTVILKQSTRTEFGNKGYTRLTPSAIVGVGRGMDFSFGVPTKINYNKHTTLKSDIGLKKVWFMGASTRLTTGIGVSPSFNMPVTPDTFAYAHVTKRIKKSKTSITAGGYMTGESHFVNQGGIMLGVDQVIIRNKLRLALDWASGEDNKGNLAVGLKYRPIPDISITASVLIPNENSDRTAFQISISKTIQIDNDNDNDDKHNEKRL